MRSKYLQSIAILAASLAPGLVCPQASAASWGSIRANNHENQNAGQRAPQSQVRGRETEGAVNRQAVISREPARVEERRPEAERERVEVRQPDRRAVEWTHDATAQRHEDIDEDRRHGYFWNNYNPGMIINTLPPDYSQVNVSGNPYYYDQGVYYQPGQSGYVVVAPPLGAVVPAVPPGAESMQVGSNIYYYAGAAFYVQTQQGFLVVAPPIGVTIGALPPNATALNINGAIYYQAGPTYFMPVMQAGVTAYAVVPRP